MTTDASNKDGAPTLYLPNKNVWIGALEAHQHLMTVHHKNLDEVIRRLGILDEVMATLENPESQRHLPSGLIEATKAWRSMMPAAEAGFQNCQRATT